MKNHRDAVNKPNDATMKKNTTQNMKTSSTTPATAGSTVKTTTVQLTAAKKQALARCVESIRGYQTGQTDKFHKLALACFEIQRDELYLEYGTQAAFYKREFGFSPHTRCA